MNISLILFEHLLTFFVKVCRLTGIQIQLYNNRIVGKRGGTFVGWFRCSGISGQSTTVLNTILEITLLFLIKVCKHLPKPRLIGIARVRSYKGSFFFILEVQESTCSKKRSQ